jgi:dynein heavy chain 2
VQALQKSFTKTTAEAEVLRQKFEAAERTLEAANGLLGKLSGEKARWDGQVVELRSSLKLLPIQVLLASAFVCYAGEHAEDRRRAMFADWCAACDVNSSEFDMLRFLSSESQMLQWKSTGLPADQLSLENAVIMEQIGNQGPVPFVIDPGLRATSWLQKHFITIEAPSKGSDKSAATVETVAHQDSRFVTVLELAVRFGKSLIVTECDHIDALLMPLLRRDSVVQVRLPLQFLIFVMVWIVRSEMWFFSGTSTNGASWRQVGRFCCWLSPHSRHSQSVSGSAP